MLLQFLSMGGKYNRLSSPFFPETLPSYTDYDSATQFRKFLKSLESKEHPIDVPRHITTRMYITASMDKIVHNLSADMDYALASSLNNISWINPSTAVLEAYYITASLPVNGWLTIRFKANNPGVWAMHCQEGIHLSWGMNTVMIVKNGSNPETSIRSPPANMPPCEISPFVLRPLDVSA
ncbi:hypothetical protein CRYUN_Cryun27aG0024400 [Craigia yunnanensis]